MDTDEMPRAATALDAIAWDYVRLTLALGERDPDSMDFAIAPAAMKREAHQRYAPLDAIANKAAEAQIRLGALRVGPEEQERAFTLRLQLQSLEARTRMLRGRTLPFDVEAHALFATERLPDTRANERRALRETLAKLLPRAHPSEDPAARLDAYERKFIVPPDRLQRVMQAALQRCRAATLPHIAMPAGESVTLTFVRNQPWSAFSRYQGKARSTISLNLDLPITVDDALELACHEGYPGHHTFNTLRDATLGAHGNLPEALVQPTFSPQSYVSEAAAAYAPQLAFSLPERTQVEHDVLFPLAGLLPAEAARYVQVKELVRELDSAEPAIARDYLDGRLEFMRAEEALARDLLMAHGEASLLYLNEYRSYALAYTDGRRRVAAFVEREDALPERRPGVPRRASTEQRWARYEQMMRRMQVRLP